MCNAAREEEQKEVWLSGASGLLSAGEMETAAGGKRLAGSRRKTEMERKESVRERETVKFHNEKILCSLKA